jgi:hypothetical protein
MLLDDVVLTIEQFHVDGQSVVDAAVYRCVTTGCCRQVAEYGQIVGRHRVV